MWKKEIAQGKHTQNTTGKLFAPKGVFSMAYTDGIPVYLAELSRQNQIFQKTSGVLTISNNPPGRNEKSAESDRIFRNSYRNDAYHLFSNRNIWFFRLHPSMLLNFSLFNSRLAFFSFFFLAQREESRWSIR